MKLGFSLPTGSVTVKFTELTIAAEAVRLMAGSIPSTMTSARNRLSNRFGFAFFVLLILFNSFIESYLPYIKFCMPPNVWLPDGRIVFFLKAYAGCSPCITGLPCSFK